MKMAHGNDHKGLGDPSVLEKIDNLFACNVGEHIDLPQLVMVGDQSSGKSSVLEGLTKLPFPRDSGLCTRFATQIIFRRSLEEKINVSIIPDANAKSEHAEKLRAWSKPGLTNLDGQSFAEIMTEVNEIMGLSSQKDKTTGNGSTFSKDVLRLEISGKNEQHLSVIDVPGIFKSTTLGLTTKADIVLVKSIVQGYMDNPRSVMLTVIPANVDIATQEILELAADADPDGHRTLGVLTKPDLVDKGAEPRAIDLLEGRAHKMRYGWHVVRNPGQQHLSISSADRQELEEEFFSTQAPWKGLDEDRVGIEALRIRLQDVHATHIRREFPKVKIEIGRKLKRAQTDLSKLGTERESTAKQSAYLLDLATKFQRLVSLALDAKYGSDDCFDEDTTLRLATEVISRNSTFAEELDAWGQEYQFSSSGDITVTTLLERVSASALWPEAQPLESEPTKPAEPAKLIEIRKVQSQPELEEILHEQEVLYGCRKENIRDWLKDVYLSSRGFGLGTFDSSILSTTMKKQTAKWNGFALGYVSDIVAIVHRFITKLLEITCADDRVTTGLSTVLTEGLMQRYSRAIEHVRFILRVERLGTPMTMDKFFSESLEERRQKRMQAQIPQMSFPDHKQGTTIRLKDMMKGRPVTNSEQVVQEIHDILSSYYEVARRRFVDSICMQAVDHFLLSGPETPLTLFSPSFVNELTPEDLESIAGEDGSTKRKRKQLKREIKSLEAGKRILI